MRIAFTFLLALLLVWVPAHSEPLVTRENSVLTIDFLSTACESEKVRAAFGNTGAVYFERAGGMVLRLDGLLGRDPRLSEESTELVTHFHSDHIRGAVLERLLSRGMFLRIVSPYPVLQASRGAVFTMLLEKTAGDENGVIVITRSTEGAEAGSQPSVPLSLFTLRLGDFIYASLDAAEDIRVEMLKYLHPRDVNSDGLVFRVSHKSVSYLFFGDFDDSEGIDKMLDIFAEYNVKANIIKWPHHAHRFPRIERSDAVLIRMNEVLEPSFIIWEAHHTQRDFREYIERFPFAEKFLSSDDSEIVVISFTGTLRVPRLAGGVCS